jgi:uncharacterized protein (DUF2252 family)
VRSAKLIVLAGLAAAFGCEGEPLDARTQVVASVLARADEPLLRSRPGFVEAKYAAMRASPFAFVRGSLPIHRHDWATGEIASSRFTVSLPLVRGLGDPHPENFGLLAAADGTLALEPNDFDAADRVPYLWDVRRLAASLAVAVSLSNADDAAARQRAVAARPEVVRRFAASYAQSLAAIARGEPGARAIAGRGGPVVDDLFRRGARDLAARAELSGLTEITAGARRLRRGVVDPEEPTARLDDAPEVVRAALPRALEVYRETLVAPVDAGELAVLDVARQLGSGVASRPRVRFLVLVRGPTDAPEDDVVLEVKELVDSGTATPLPLPVHAGSVEERVLDASRAAWARPDAERWWGASRLLGLPVQVRLESEAQKSVRVARLVGARGTPEALSSLADVLGALLARVHAVPVPRESDPAVVVSGAIGADVAAFAEEQAAFAEGYAARSLGDAARFAAALDALGPRLGVPIDPIDAPRADTRALWGTP